MRFLISALLLMTFFASGCAALIYQLVWQRFLFSSIGVDIDSVTLIVSTFMLGIGVGGALGGWSADRWQKGRLQIYGLAELSLAIFGVFSPYIFSEIQNLTLLGSSYWLMCVISVAVILVPTIIMGMTLPILTMYFDEHLRNVGVSVGNLYFFNTLGAAFGAWISAWVLFEKYGLANSAKLASLINFSCFMIVLLLWIGVNTFTGKPKQVKASQ
ncbi:hypothetical protein G7048_12845 [Diaphorobacter sp. HDW4B]|uniref:MFS transporter n=1 Tax=Diaphorobacter sp. HDW4B TaxID=2714925 RepID=UPI00140B6CEB|nr:MFS transporter [Diaphorobacter sp. HDW4B]QIL71171.1 hypothetical protein G7048_12845 [Diaphorobacter sp. HDW4B]